MMKVSTSQIVKQEADLVIGFLRNCDYAAMWIWLLSAGIVPIQGLLTTQDLKRVWRRTWSLLQCNKHRCCSCLCLTTVNLEKRR